MRRPAAKRIGLLAAIAVFTVASAFTSLAAREKLDTPDNLYWSSTSKDDDSDYDEGSYAKWDPVDNATKYELTLYCEDENGSVRTMASGITTKSTKYNFRSKMTREGDYYFRVRAQSSKSDYSDSSWSHYSDTYYVTASAAENAANGDYDDSQSTAVIVSRDPGWTTNETGIWYQRADGSYPAGGWFQDPADQRWFYLDENGYVKTGFIEDGDKIYYCDPAGTPYGAMVTGTVLLDGVIYNFDDSGTLISTEDGSNPEENS